MKNLKITFELTPKEFWAIATSIGKHGGRPIVKRFLKESYEHFDQRIRKIIFQNLEESIGSKEMDKLDTEWKSCVIEPPPPKPKPLKKQPLPRGVWRNF